MDKYLLTKMGKRSVIVILPTWSCPNSSSSLIYYMHFVPQKSLLVQIMMGNKTWSSWIIPLQFELEFENQVDAYYAWISFEKFELGLFFSSI